MTSHVEDMDENDRNNLQSACNLLLRAMPVKTARYVLCAGDLCMFALPMIVFVVVVVVVVVVVGFRRSIAIRSASELVKIASIGNTNLNL